MEDKSENRTSKILPSNKTTYRYGEEIPTRYGRLIITKSKFYNNGLKDYQKSIDIIISPLENLVASFKTRLKVDPISKTSSVVAVSINAPVVEKSDAFLNNLIQIYNEDAASDKNFISENTSKFIADRLTLITQELDGKTLIPFIGDVPTADSP